MKRYFVNEIFYSIQGEGYWTGCAAIFCRFSRCNLWTGREQDRGRAICQFCDTDFVHADRFSLRELIHEIGRLAPVVPRQRDMVILTGGEPALQADQDLIDELHAAGFYVAIETNGTQPLPDGIDWVCVSPKAAAPLHPQCTEGNELKVVYPQPDLDLNWLSGLEFDHHWLSPMDGPNLADNTSAALKYVLAHPQWRLNIQTHKVIGVR